MLRPVYHERAKSSGGTRDVFLLSDAGNTNQLVRLEIVCADSMKLAHRAMLEYFSSCSAVQPFPIASDDTGSVGDYCYFGYGKPWTSVMFVRDNVFVALKSLASMSSVRQEAEAIDKEIMRLASGNCDSGMAAGIAEEQKASSLNLSGIVAKTNVVEFLSYQRSIGLATMQNKLTPNDYCRGQAPSDFGFSGSFDAASEDVLMRHQKVLRRGIKINRQGTVPKPLGDYR